MNTGGYDPRLNATIKRFNGGLFKNVRALPLDQDDIIELHNAACRGWGDVEPAIFGTLLESALDPAERAQLGAHYTPRPYVERLVIPTIMEPLRADWEEVKAGVEDLRRQGNPAGALQAVRNFHHRLCTVRVLDPACGTGNFLYVSLELMKRLEGEVLDALDALGENESKLLLDGETVSPRQFFGLELNPRAVPIADLVLWIGFLKWQLKTVDAKDIPEPILNAYGTIQHQDALLAYDSKDLAIDAHGNVITLWDGVTKKVHPITGREVPEETARRETYSFRKPRRAEWPVAEFIVGNPPFIGGKDMRAELGDGYAEACWKVRPEVSGGADFVMHFWDEAARRLSAKPAKKGGTNPLRRFGFITTNSITQTFSRRVVERWMAGKEPLSLIYAVPDHPWMKSADKAAVRIAMTVVQAGDHEGVLATVISEADLNTDTPKVELERRDGKMTAHLRIGADLSKAEPLLANELVASPGVKLHGAGFIVTPKDAAALGLGSVPGLEAHILHYRHGRDLAQRPRGVMVIDLFGLTAEQVRDRFPAVYQRILDRVKPERDQNNRAVRRNNWWLFGETAPLFREYTSGISRYVATGETAKHRFFQFLDSATRADNMLLAIGTDLADRLAILSSRLHVHWAVSTGARMGMGNDPRYSKTRTFDPFVFPLAIPSRLAELGERLDAFRKARLAAHDSLTMTGLYNALERLRELDAGIGDPLIDAERDVYDAGQIAILKNLHDEIDHEVFAAYGWSDLGDRLVGKPGGTIPSLHKSENQQAAEEELLVRLVALNRERIAEEKMGTIRWLRPDFQRARLAAKVKCESQIEANLGEAAIVEEAKWPADRLDQIRSVRDLLARATAPISIPALAAAFAGRNTPKRRDRVEQVLETLISTGAARRDEATSGYYLPR